MRFAMFNGWGKPVGPRGGEPVRDGGDALRLWLLYRNASYGILVASNGRPCEMLVR